MKRHQFLGTTDLSVVSSLLSNYKVPTKIPDATYLHTITQQDDLVLLQLGALLTPEECDEIVGNLQDQQFEKMSEKYDEQTRSSSRLIVLDDPFAHILWRRLNSAHNISKYVPNPRPLGFNVQGRWKLSGVNPAMRINRYDSKEFFAAHKDAQYAPSGDERSLLSLLIYLNDNYQDGETKFYFPKVQPQIEVKGLSIQEEINAHQGLDHGYECISIKPRKGHAILFSHHLLHEAVRPVIPERSEQRIVLRTDVVVQRQDKPLGFAVSDEEREDYIASLNYFREAQQQELHLQDEKKSARLIGELYERSLSIRYCYPRLLEKKLASAASKKKKKDKTESMVDKLPTEMWFNIWNYLHEQDVHNFIFAYPKFQSMKISWQMREAKSIETDPQKPKFIPTIETTYGCQTLFRFSDSDFFVDHIQPCLRVAAVYAFFLLGNGSNATHYVVRFNRSTQEICEVEMEKLFSDVFYNRHCYGSLYRVHQQDENKRQPTVDLNHSVDRIHMINQNQTEFIGTDIASRFHFQFDTRKRRRTDAQSDDDTEENYGYYGRPPTNAICVEESMRDSLTYSKDIALIDDTYTHASRFGKEEKKTNYTAELLKQTHQMYGSSAARMIVSNDEPIGRFCFCFHSSKYDTNDVLDHTCTYNHLIFDFDTHRMTVEERSEESSKFGYSKIMPQLIQQIKRSKGNDILKVSYYRVNIEELTTKGPGFNHASCNCSGLTIVTDQLSFLDYTYLTHVDLAVIYHQDHVSVLTVYGGVAAL